MELIKINQSNGKQAVSARGLLYTLHFTLYNSILNIIHLSISNLYFKSVKGVYTSTLHLKYLPINKITLKSVKCKGVYTLDSYKIYRGKIFFLKKSVKFTLFVPKLLSISALRCKGMCKHPLHFLYLSC